MRGGIHCKPLRFKLKQSIQIIDACLRLHNFIVDYRESQTQPTALDHLERTFFDDDSTRFYAVNPGLDQHYSILVSHSKIQHSFDNEEALRHLNTLGSFTDSANPLSIDYDVWAALHGAATSTPGSHFGTHVKGHQDGTDLLENLSAEAQLNVRMDEIAGLCRHSHAKHLKTRTHTGNNIVLEINGEIITSNMHSTLRFEKTARPLRDHIMKKQG